MNITLYLASLFLVSTSSPSVDVIRQALSAHSDRMFFWLVFSSAVTGIGVIFEAPAEIRELKRWWELRRLGRAVGWRVPITFIGLALVIVGIIGEGVFEFLSADAETAIRAHDEQVLGDTITKAGNAKESADSAAVAARNARLASGDAVSKANGAVSSAKQASISAGEAIKEADTFEQGIVSAKQEAADAVSRLADAERRLADATQKEANAEAKLAAIKTPRSLIKFKELIAILEQFKGTEYTLNVFQDDESIQLTKSVDEALREAGWVRKQHGTYRLGVASFNIFQDGTPNHDESVPVCIETGVQIHVRSTKSLQVLLATPPSALPKTILSASLLRTALQTSISPSEERNVGDRVILDEENHSEGPMVICVGKKP